MKTKRFLCIVMALLMLLPLLFACDNGETDTSITNSESEVIDPNSITLTIGEKEISATRWNSEFNNGTAYYFTSTYAINNGMKFSITIEEDFENYKAVTVKATQTDDGYEHEILEISDAVKSVKIPTVGFVLALPNEMLDNAQLKEGMLVEISGGEKLFYNYERTDLARLYPNSAKNIAVKQIDLVDPINDFDDKTIYFLSEDYSVEGKTLPEKSAVITLEKTSGSSYTVKSVENTLSEKGLRLVFTGDYNVEYVNAYIKVGEKIMISSLNKANSFTNKETLVFEKFFLPFNKAVINSEYLNGDGYYLYTNEFLGAVTPKCSKKRIDVTIVDDVVAYIGEEGERTLIPDGNGVTVTFVGDESMQKANVLKVGDRVKEKYFISYEELGDKFVSINGVNYEIDLVDDIRAPEGVCALYTPDFGKTTDTNIYGTEIVVSGGEVIKVEIGKGNVEIPADGFVLSIHKDNVKITEANRVKKGEKAELNLEGSDYRVLKLKYDGINVTRGENMLIVYKNVATTGTNMYGYEIVVDKDGLASSENFSGNAKVPVGGFVLSGHGDMIKVLQGAYARGEIITLDESSKEVLIIKTPILRLNGADDAIQTVVDAFDEAKKEYKTINYPKITEELEALRAELEKSEKAISDGDFESAMEIAKSVKNKAEKLKFQTIESNLAENRAMWYRSDEKSDEEVRETIAKLKSLNVNTLYLETWFDGYCPGFIDVEGVTHSPYNGNFDALEAFIRIGHEEGIEIHAWVENFFVGYLNKDGTFSNDILNKFKNQLLLDKEGNNFYYYNERATFVFLNPFDRECRDYILEVYTKLIEKYDLDGIHLDYIRFPELNYGKNDYGYNADIIDAFKKETGITQDPRTFAEGTANDNKWDAFRANIITTFVKEVFDLVCDRSPEMLITCATYPDMANAKKTIAQDVESWVKNGYIDEVFSMTYSGDNNYVYDNAKKYSSVCNGKSFYSTGLAAFMDTTNENFAYQLPIVKQAGATGISIFALANINPNNYQNEIILGAFRDCSTQLYKYGDTVKAKLEEIKNKLNWSLSFYEHITKSDVSAIISEMEKIKLDVTSKNDASEKIKYCSDTVNSLNSLKTSITEKCGTNDETDSIIEEIDELIYVLNICSGRLNAKNNRG
ncbi:MAG: family 10 glycosylhydrolase [Clostridia bacterium]|nr:family 10 glycosylhydrolase [Clostridia bacterium]